MRTGILCALGGAALLATTALSQAAPLSATGAAALDQALPDARVTQVHYWYHHRHYGWWRGHHYGWYRHRHYYPAYGYYRPYRHYYY